MKQENMAKLRRKCVDGNDRACETLEQLCEGGRKEVCHYVP